MTEFKGKLQIQDSTGVNTTVVLDGDKGNNNSMALRDEPVQIK